MASFGSWPVLTVCVLVDVVDVVPPCSIDVASTPAMQLDYVATYHCSVSLLGQGQTSFVSQCLVSQKSVRLLFPS